MQTNSAQYTLSPPEKATILDSKIDITPLIKDAIADLEKLGENQAAALISLDQRSNSLLTFYITLLAAIIAAAITLHIGDKLAGHFFYGLGFAILIFTIGSIMCLLSLWPRSYAYPYEHPGWHLEYIKCVSGQGVRPEEVMLEKLVNGTESIRINEKLINAKVSWFKCAAVVGALGPAVCASLTRLCMV